MVSDRMYRRMCMSGWQAAQERKKQESRNAAAAQDRRTRVMLEIEYMLRNRCGPWMFEEFYDRFDIHPTKRAVVTNKITPIIQEFIDRGELAATTEFFPKEGVFRILLTIPREPIPARKQRGLDL